MWRNYATPPKRQLFKTESAPTAGDARKYNNRSPDSPLFRYCLKHQPAIDVTEYVPKVLDSPEQSTRTGASRAAQCTCNCDCHSSLAAVQPINILKPEFDISAERRWSVPDQHADNRDVSPEMKAAMSTDDKSTQATIRRCELKLTRSWSINNERIHKDVTRNPNADRRTSLNETELRRQRRSSSVIRLLCLSKHDATVEENVAGYVSDLTAGERKISKSTRLNFQAAKPATDPLDDFRKLYEKQPTDDDNVQNNGGVNLRFQYMISNKTLQITLITASNLPVDHLTKINFFVEISLIPGKGFQRKGTSRYSTNNPVLLETFHFHNVEFDDLLMSNLRVAFYNKPGTFSRRVSIGYTDVPLYKHDLTSETVLWKPLEQPTPSKQSRWACLD